MLLQSTWKKALKLGMKKVFSIEELVTSVPTERGARMSKNGKKALDQDRLNIVKGMQNLNAYCLFIRTRQSYVHRIAMVYPGNHSC